MMRIYLPPFILILILIISFVFTSNTTHAYGIIPLTLDGIPGIFTAPLIHGSISHLVSNCISFAIVGSILFVSMNKIAYFVCIVSYIIPGIITWFIGRHANHIGASGMIYAIASFLLFMGFFSNKRELLALSFVVLFLNSGLLWGIIPTEQGVSWEYHLGGFITGVVLAYFFKNFSFSKTSQSSSFNPTTNTTFENTSYTYTYKKASRDTPEAS